MQRTMLKSKIHRATVTQADLHYVGSVTVDEDLMDAADLLPGEQVAVVDITNGAHVQKVSTEQFMEKGKRVLFNSVIFDKEDIEGNKKYLITLEERRHIIASGTFILREQGPHYSGKVTFTDEDTKANSDSH